MQARGYTVIELMVVTAVIGILLAFAIPRFSQRLRDSRIEAQTRQIYGRLQETRASALFHRRGIRVRLYRDRFDVYSSSQDKGAAPVQTMSLAYPVTCNGSGDGVKGYPIDFDHRGITSDWCSICLVTGSSSSSLDSIILSANRISLGKKDKGDECKKDNITVR